MTLDSSDLAIIVPLWQRTADINRVYDSIRAATPDARVVWVVSFEDFTVRAAIAEHALIETGNHTVCYPDGAGGDRGDYARKINMGYRATSEPFVFTGVDDLNFHRGWYEAAIGLMGVRAGLGYDDDGTPRYGRTGVVGTVDLCNGRTSIGTHSTHSLVARWYADCCAVVDQPEAIYHEGYWHEYCDDELVGYAKSKGAYAHAHGAVVEHLHPNVAKSPDDVTYRRGRAMSRSSRRTFTTRRRLWEPR